MSSTRTSHSVQELRQLIAQLERSGIAEQRPEARALLLRSRALLRQHRGRRLAGKLGLVATLALDGALLAGLTVLLLGTPPLPVVITFAALAPAWLMFRLRHQAHWLAEALRWSAYHLAWLYDWFAEAISTRAMARLDARMAAREVMWGWRQYRRALPHRPRLEDVAAFLAAEYGPGAEREFRRMAEALDQAREWTTRGGPARNGAALRLAALRWSALIGLFGRLAAEGALWPESLPAEPARAGWPPAADAPGMRAAFAAASAATPDPAQPADTPERAARRADLRDIIRRKRQDITSAFGWHLKTEAEIAQRDQFLAQTRAEIAELERELVQIGG